MALLSGGFLAALDIESTRKCVTRDDVRYSWSRLIYMNVYCLLVAGAWRLFGPDDQLMYGVTDHYKPSTGGPLQSSSHGLVEIGWHYLWSILAPTIFLNLVYAGTHYWSYKTGRYDAWLSLLRTDLSNVEENESHPAVSKCKLGVRRLLWLLRDRYLGRELYDSWIAYRHSHTHDITAVSTQSEVEALRNQLIRYSRRHTSASTCSGGLRRVYEIEMQSYIRRVPRYEVLVVDPQLCRLKTDIFVPIAEEVLFRYVGCNMLLWLGETPNSAIAISSVAFSVLHMVDPAVRYLRGVSSLRASIFTGLFASLYTLAFGYYSSVLYFRTNSIVACIVSHFICNTLHLPELTAFSQAAYEICDRHTVRNARLSHLIGLGLACMVFTTLTAPHLFPFSHLYKYN